jgi:signal transduction histidine kinase
MSALLYIRLIGYTAGTLLMLFWMVVILGYRRQRNFERVFFFLCLALFFFYGGSLLALNGEIYYSHLPAFLTLFLWTILTTGLSFTPALLLHLHFEYQSAPPHTAEIRGRFGFWKTAILIAAYLSAAFFMLKANPRFLAPYGDFLIPAKLLGVGYGVYLAASLAACGAFQFWFSARTSQRVERRFHLLCASVLLIASICAFALHVVFRDLPQNTGDAAATALSLLALIPFVLLIYAVEKHNFLQIGRQKNLMYAISVTFLALLYLSLVRRIGVLLEPALPPEATAAILLFVLVIFVEPMQRLLAARLRTAAKRELDQVRRLITEIREKAREGDLQALVRFVAVRIREQFEFEQAALELHKPYASDTDPLKAAGAGMEIFPVYQHPWLNAVLSVRPHGAMLSGETRAALEFLCEQLPAALDLCRLIEEKLRLERELAERERLAALGQMAASISHNLKNPLGSIKTILQVQLENPELPQSLRNETQLMLDEISRLSAKLNQLLQFSRPAFLGYGNAAFCDASEIAREVASVLRHDADRKGLVLQLNPSSPAQSPISTPAETVRDILSNLVVNALDATPGGGCVAIGISERDGHCEITVTDNGPGIPADLHEKILQPFFTTKAHGTGLGLAIVVRRVAEVGGTLDLQSPVQDGRGTRFLVRLPLARTAEGKGPLNA